PLIGKGRANYKRYRYEDGDTAHLKDAEKDLEAAIKLLQLARNRDPEGEARLWLGLTYLWQGNDVKAADNIRHGIERAVGGWLTYASGVVQEELERADAS